MTHDRTSFELDERISGFGRHQRHDVNQEIPWLFAAGSFRNIEAYARVLIACQQVVDVPRYARFWNYICHNPIVFS